MSLAACAIHTAYNKEKNKNVGEKSMRQTFAPNEQKSGQMKFFCAFGAGQREPCPSSDIDHPPAWSTVEIHTSVLKEQTLSRSHSENNLKVSIQTE